MNAEGFGECAICLASLFVLDLVDAESDPSGGANAAESPVVAIACGHLFHATCVAQLTGVQMRCPLCRAAIADSDDDEGARVNPLMPRRPKSEFLGCKGAVRVRPVAMPRPAAAASLKRAAPFLSQAQPRSATSASPRQQQQHQPSPELRRQSYLADLKRRVATVKSENAKRERDAAASGGDLRTRLNALQRERTELAELAEVATTLQGGSIRKVTDRAVLARCIAALQKRLGASRARVRAAGERREVLERKARRYEALIADLGVDLEALEADSERLGVATGANRAAAPAAAELPHHARPLEVRAPPPPVDDSAWELGSTRADAGGVY